MPPCAREELCNTDKMTFCKMSFSPGIKEGGEGILIKVKLHSPLERTRQLRKRFCMRLDDVKRGEGELENSGEKSRLVNR